MPNAYFDEDAPVSRIGALLADFNLPTNEAGSTGGKNPLKRAMQTALKAPQPKAAPAKPDAKPAAKDKTKPDAKPADKAPAAKAKPQDAAPEPSPEELKLSRDLGELYGELLSRWQSVADPLHQGDDAPMGPIEWSADNPYGDLPAQVREMLQVGAVFHFEELEDMRNVAERAMRQWQRTQPMLLDELGNSLKGLPDRHLRVLRPLVAELVERKLLPLSALTYTDPVNNTDQNYWAKAFPLLMAANAYQHQRKTITSQNQDHHKLASAVTSTLTEALLSEA